MKRRKWDAKTKAIIVLEGLKGKPVAMSCQDYQISQAQYDQWGDQFLAHAPKRFEVAQQTDREARLQRENARLKKLVGELTLELHEDVCDARGHAGVHELQQPARERRTQNGSCGRLKKNCSGSGNGRAR